ncbi:MAG: hypothetical protein ABJA87_01010 [bacterium]
MKAVSTPTARRGPARLVLALGLVFAVLAMHGPGVGHELPLPTPGQFTMAGHPPTTAAMAPGSARDGAASRVEHWAANGDTGMCGMAHGDCLGTLRTAAPHLVPGGLSYIALNALAINSRTHAAEPALIRTPPGPSLDRLCISRT